MYLTAHSSPIMTNSANDEAESNRTTTSSERQVPPVTPHPHQKPLLGRILIPLGILIGISGLLELYFGWNFLSDLPDQSPESIDQMLPEYLKEIIYQLSEVPYIAETTTVLLFLLVLVPGALLALAGHAIAVRGRRHVARVYQGNTPPAIEAPILYLRPFMADGYVALLTGSSVLKVVFNWLLDKRERTVWWLALVFGMRPRYEELLAYAFRRVGPLMAIGDPKERLPLLGATRIYTGEPGLADSVDDETWRKVVDRQIENAQLILLHVGLSDGLRWEVKRVIQLADPQRVVLCLNRELTRGLPFKMILRGVRRGEIQAIQEMWSQFRNNFAAIFPHGLPEVIGDARFVKFDSDWTPSPMETAKRKLVWFLPGPAPDLSRKTIDSAFAWLTWILVPEKLGRPVVRYIINVASVIALGFWVVPILVLDVLLMGGHLIGAIVDVSSAKTPHTVAAQEWFQRGFTADNSDEKIRSYTEALRLSPDFANAYYNRGVAKYMKDDLDGEISDYTEALRLQPDFVNAYYYRGNARSKKDDLDGAITDYTEALRLKPDNAKTYYNRGDARYRKGDLDGAITDYTEVLRLKPDDADAYHSRGFARAKKGDLDGAVTDYTEALRLEPDVADTYYDRGLALEAKGDLTAAQRDFDKVQLLKGQLEK